MLKYNEYFSNVQSVLNDLGGICKRCILRYGGVKSSREHRNLIIEDNLKLKVQKFSVLPVVYWCLNTICPNCHFVILVHVSLKIRSSEDIEYGPPDSKIIKKDKHITDSAENVKKQSDGICLACLGVLQENFIEKIIDDVRYF